jgi:hypothetical protein
MSLHNIMSLHNMMSCQQFFLQLMAGLARIHADKASRRIKGRGSYHYPALCVDQLTNSEVGGWACWNDGEHNSH